MSLLHNRDDRIGLRKDSEIYFTTLPLSQKRVLNDRMIGE
jgi:hypothetical protein